MTSLRDDQQFMGRKVAKKRLPPSPFGISKDELRDAVLPEYDGSSDEHILAGKVTAKEALEVFRKHYEGQAVIVDAVGIAEVYTMGGKRQIWLPVKDGFGQKIKQQVIEIVHLKGEVRTLQDEIRLVRSDNRALRDRLKENMEKNSELLKRNRKLHNELKKVTKKLRIKRRTSLVPSIKRS